jgi:rfaE bifunctional protein nucleotidyltransferase chain/domain
MGLVIPPTHVRDFMVEFREHQPKAKLIFTNGCFDLLHIGHIRYLQSARKLGTFLFVGLNSDNSVKMLKGDSRPLQSQLDRAEILSALGCVDAVSIFDEETPLSLIKAIRPDFLVKGGDWSKEKIVGSEFVESYGGVIKSLEFVEGHSTTSIIHKMKA